MSVTGQENSRSDGCGQGCPHVRGDITERDCAYPECMPQVHSHTESKPGPVQTEVCPVCRTAHDKPLCPIPEDWCEHNVPRRFCTALHESESK